MHCNWVKQKSFSSALLEAQSCLEAHWVEETASTNDDVKEWVKKADEDISRCLVTDRQTAGRAPAAVVGRTGRIGSFDRRRAAFRFRGRPLGTVSGCGGGLCRISLETQSRCKA